MNWCVFSMWTGVAGKSGKKTSNLLIWKGRAMSKPINKLLQLVLALSCLVSTQVWAGGLADWAKAFAMLQDSL